MMNAKMRNRVGKLIICLLLIGLMPAYAQKKGKEKVYRLPDDLETLAGDPDLLKKPEGLLPLMLFRIIILRPCITNYMHKGGRSTI